MVMADSCSYQAASMMMVGFEGVEPAPEMLRFIQETPPAGIIFFSRNITDVDQLTALIRHLRALWPATAPTPLFAIDQEGGRVRRLKPPQCPNILDVPDMALLGKNDDPNLTRAVGALMGAQLAAIGLNVDFAPVLDVNSNPDNPIIGTRAFGADADTVIRHGLALAEGLLSHGVLPCGKHFPGHGDTELDSHLELPYVEHGRERLEAIEWAPFKAAAGAFFPMIMSAHVVYPALDSTLPATLSPHVIPELLRKRWGFDGVVVSDDLEMGAVEKHHSMEEIARRGLSATIDLFLMCRSITKIYAFRDAFAQHLRDDDTALTRAQAGLTRLHRMRQAAVDHAANPSRRPLPQDEAISRKLEQLAP
jgi:beta-N-acetylhexosaminidase